MYLTRSQASSSQWPPTSPLIKVSSNARAESTLSGPLNGPFALLLPPPPLLLLMLPGLELNRFDPALFGRGNSPVTAPLSLLPVVILRAHWLRSSCLEAAASRNASMSAGEPPLVVGSSAEERELQRKIKSVESLRGRELCSMTLINTSNSPSSVTAASV